jgi:fluoroquinolone transport system permease protein
MRISSFIRAEARRLARDPMTLVFYAASPFLGALLGLALWPLAAWACAEYLAFDLHAYDGLLAVVLIQLPPSFVGMGAGFLILDDRDTSLLAPISVTPGGARSYLARRAGFAAAVCLLECLAMPFAAGSLPLNGENLLTAFGAAASAAPLAAFYALFLGAVARNKVEGMSLGKAMSVIDAGAALAFFVSGPWALAGGLIPTFAPAKAAMGLFGSGWAGGFPGYAETAAWMLASLAYAALLSGLALKACARRTEVAGGF